MNTCTHRRLAPLPRDTAWLTATLPRDRCKMCGSGRAIQDAHYDRPFKLASKNCAKV